MTAKKKAKKPATRKHRLKAGDTATINATKPESIRLVPEYIDLRLHRDEAREISDLLETVSDEIHTAQEKGELDNLPASVRVDLHMKMEGFFQLAQRISKAYWGRDGE